MSLMISVSGIRGIFGSGLTPSNLVEFTAAYGTWAKSGTIVVGRDSRVTGQLCEDIICATLQSVGCSVVKLGIVPTPTVAMAVLDHKAQGGIIISASHNPGEWNALKLLNEKSEFLDADQGKAVIDLAQKKQFSFTDAFSIGSVVTDTESVKRHVEAILNLPYIQKEVIEAAHFSVVLDAVNGAGSTAIPYLFNALGVHQQKLLHCTPNGDFPHNPEPLPEHLTEICSVIADHPADIGFVVDPDADRLAIIDEQGNLYGEEYTQAAAMDFYLGKKKGDIATNLSSSRVCEDVAEQHGVTCYRSAVGEINVVKKMQATNAVIGGEGNGGVINPDLHYGRDALVGIAMILQHLAETKLTASEYRKKLPSYFMVKKKAQLDAIDGDLVLKTIAEDHAHLQPDLIDGVKINYEKSWVHLRKSNTEPIIRIYTEAPTREEADSLATSFIEKIQTI